MEKHEIRGMGATELLTAYKSFVRIDYFALNEEQRCTKTLVHDEIIRRLEGRTEAQQDQLEAERAERRAASEQKRQAEIAERKERVRRSCEIKKVTDGKRCTHEATTLMRMWRTAKTQQVCNLHKRWTEKNYRNSEIVGPYVG